MDESKVHHMIPLLQCPVCFGRPCILNEKSIGPFISGAHIRRLNPQELEEQRAVYEELKKLKPNWVQLGLPFKTV